MAKTVSKIEAAKVHASYTRVVDFSGDDSVTLAGGRTKFVTEVSVDNTGMSVWSGPATFKANCKLEIGNWPFDNQTCEMGFGSYTYGVGRMELKLFKDTSGEFTSK